MHFAACDLRPEFCARQMWTSAGHGERESPIRSTPGLAGIDLPGPKTDPPCKTDITHAIRRSRGHKLAAILLLRDPRDHSADHFARFPAVLLILWEVWVRLARRSAMASEATRLGNNRFAIVNDTVGFAPD